MSRPQNRITLDAEVHEILAMDDGLTKFIALASKVGAGGRDEYIPCVAFGKNAGYIANDLDTIDVGDMVRIKGGLRVEDGVACVLMDSVRPIYHRDDD